MDKKFSELQAGDKFYIWLYNCLIEDKVKDVQTKQSVRKMDRAIRPWIAADEVRVILDKDSSYYIDGKNNTAMIWGTDGWHEYIILGTSKQAVKALLEQTLTRDKKKLENDIKRWLSKFDN